MPSFFAVPSIIWVSNCPARPTNGMPCASSSAPGPSPTKTSGDCGLPTPKTILLRPSDRRQRWQSPMSSTILRSVSPVGARGGRSIGTGLAGGSASPTAARGGKRVGKERKRGVRLRSAGVFDDLEGRGAGRGERGKIARGGVGRRKRLPHWGERGKVHGNGDGRGAGHSLAAIERLDAQILVELEIRLGRA